MDLQALKIFYQVDRRELAVSLLATLGVAAVGAVQAILVAVILALLRFVRLVSRPKVEILGTVPGLPGLHSDRASSECRLQFPVYCCFASTRRLYFSTRPFFKRSVLEAVEAAGPT